MGYYILAYKRLRFPEGPEGPPEGPTPPAPEAELEGIDHLGVVDYRGIRTRFFGPSKDDRVGPEPWRLRFRPLRKRRFYRETRFVWHVRRFLWRRQAA
jgi:hypothetical protein